MASSIDSTKPIAGNPTTLSVRDNFSAAKGEIEALQATVPVPASTTEAGIVELATGAETNTGTDATRAVTPDGLNDWTGSAQVTTLGTIVTGVWNGTIVAEAYLPNATTSAEGIVELATTAETTTGTDTTRAVTPAAYMDAGVFQKKESDVLVVTGTTDTLATTDSAKDLVYTSPTAVNVTVPGTLAVGFQCTITQAGAGLVTLISTDSLNGASLDIALGGQWSTIYLLQYSEGNWLVSGGIA